MSSARRCALRKDGNGATEQIGNCSPRLKELIVNLHVLSGSEHHRDSLLKLYARSLQV
jgi:hypothetical protein